MALNLELIFVVLLIMLITASDNLTPKIGQLFYNEYHSEEDKFQSASLNFIDEKPKDDGQWMYTQIAIMEDHGKRMEVYTGFEAGGMQPQYTRIATDEDLLKFIKLIKDGAITEDSPGLKDWLNTIKQDDILLDGEKERVAKLSSDQPEQKTK